MAPRRDKKQMDEKEGKQKITSPKRLRGPTLKPKIAKKRSEGLKLTFNIMMMHEPWCRFIIDWRVVPVELKEKLWDCVKGAFLVDENSKNNVISSIGTSFRSFRHRLTKEYILPYKDKPEYLLQPPTEYNYIPIEDWRKLVANRLSKEFQVKSKKGKERRAKYVYIHRVSRKGYAGLQEELMQKTGSRKPIDRWVLWKLARLKKGEYDEVTRPVVEKISKSLPSVGYSTKSYLSHLPRLARGKLVHLHGWKSLALPSVGPSDSKVENGVCEILQTLKKGEITWQQKGDFATLWKMLPSAQSDWLAMAANSLFQLRITHHLKHWIADFLSFEMVYSMHQLDFRKCSKSGCYDCHQEYASWQILFTFSPCIPDLLLANDFQALPKIPHNSSHS
ncbi:hypothetical protein AAG906_010483 [Vitis piasezkii]